MRDRIKRIVGESGMGDRFLRRTFSTFQLTDDNKRAAAAARRYLDDNTVRLTFCAAFSGTAYFN